MLRAISTILAVLGSLLAPALAEDVPRSECLAMANAPPRVTPVNLRRVAANTDEVVITYGGSYGNTTICAGAPPTNACPSGDVWTWDYNNEAWVCAPECDNGQYDRRAYGGQTVSVPC